MNKFVVYNGEVLPQNQVLIDPLNRGMMYGDGFFDTLRSYKGKFLLLDKHFDRTRKTAEFLGIKVRFTFQDFHDKIMELLEANELHGTEALIRVQCWREGERGYATDSEDSSWLTTCSELHTDSSPVKLITSSTRLIPTRSLPRIYKLSNGLNYIIAGNEAKRSGADDALMLSTEGWVGETTIANIFWIKGNMIFTPSADCDMLPGITRDLIIDLINDMEGYDVIVGKFEPGHLNEADAVFCTNSVREIIPVSSLDDVAFDTTNPVLKEITGSFRDFRSQNLK